MPAQIVHCNVVVVARQFNPSIFTQLWLVKNKLASESDFDEGDSVFTPPFVQVRVPKFALLVLPEQMQFAPRPAEGNHGAVVREKVGRIIQALPETPYSAVGLNFHWMLAPAQEDYSALCRALFFRDNPLYSEFESADARFGGYLSKDIFDARLKLDVKPTTVDTPDGRAEKLLFAFNFHADIKGESAVEHIERMLARWDDASTYAAQVVQKMESWKWR